VGLSKIGADKNRLTKKTLNPQKRGRRKLPNFLGYKNWKGADALTACLGDLPSGRANGDVQGGEIQKWKKGKSKSNFHSDFSVEMNKFMKYTP